MYFLNIRAVKSQLQSGTPSSAEAFPYLLAYLLLVQVAMSFPATWENIWDVLVIAVDFVAVILGTLALYTANGGRNGRDFITRYFMLGWVVALRFLLLAIPLTGLAVLVLTGLGLYEENTGAYTLFHTLIFTLLYYVYFYRHMRALRRGTTRAVSESGDS